MFPRHFVYQNVRLSRRSPTRACRMPRMFSRRAQTLVPFPVHKSLPTSLRKKFHSARSIDLRIDRNVLISAKIRLVGVAVWLVFHALNGFAVFAISCSFNVNFWRSFRHFTRFLWVENKIRCVCVQWLFNWAP